MKGRFLKGEIPWNKGMIGFKHKGSFKIGHKTNIGRTWKVSEEKKKNMGVKKGTHNSLETEFKKGKHYSINTEFKKGNLPWNKRIDEERVIKLYKKKSIKDIAKIFKCNFVSIYNILNRNNIKLRGSLKGEKSPFWKGGKSFEPYNKYFNNFFKRKIRERDNQICVLCKVHREKFKEALLVHHINYDKFLTIPENCISLCRKCHSKTNYNRKQWITFFQSILSYKYGYFYEKNMPIINMNFSSGKICSGV